MAKTKQTRRRWSPAEDSVLLTGRENSELTFKEISQFLGRPLNSTQKRYYLLQRKAPQSSTHLFELQLENMMETCSSLLKTLRS